MNASNQLNDEGRSVALYWDFENLHAGLYEEREPGSYGRENRFKLQDPVVDVQAVVEVAASFGPVAINRAYCNWQFFGRYREASCRTPWSSCSCSRPAARRRTGRTSGFASTRWRTLHASRISARW